MGIIGCDKEFFAKAYLSIRIITQYLDVYLEACRLYYHAKCWKRAIVKGTKRAEERPSRYRDLLAPWDDPRFKHIIIDGARANALEKPCICDLGKQQYVPERERDSTAQGCVLCKTTGKVDLFDNG